MTRIALISAAVVCTAVTALHSQTSVRETAYVKASNAEAYDHFGEGGALPGHTGNTVALSRDGGTMAVGAPHEANSAAGINPTNQADNGAMNAGAVYVYTRSGTGWTQQAYLKASNPQRNAHFGTVACVIGGDLNTFSAGIAEVRTRFRELRDEDRTRFTWPVPHEPLFELAASHGFDVDAANPAEQTMRLAADQRAGSLLRLDWLLVRGLEVVDRRTIPAVDPHGGIISDHDAVAATLRHRP